MAFIRLAICRETPASLKGQNTDHKYIVRILQYNTVSNSNNSNVLE